MFKKYFRGNGGGSIPMQHQRFRIRSGGYTSTSTAIGVLTYLLSSIYHHTQNLYLMPIYARAPSTGPHTIVGSKVLLHGLAALMIGFFCL